MNDITINRWAMGLAIFSFGFLSIGSFLFGATVTTAALRGFSGAILFGTSLWLTGLLVIEKKDTMEENHGEEVSAGEDLIQESVKIDPEAVRKKFLEKSNEIEKQELEEKEEEYKKEETPF